MESSVQDNPAAPSPGHVTTVSAYLIYFYGYVIVELASLIGCLGPCYTQKNFRNACYQVGFCTGFISTGVIQIL